MANSSLPHPHPFPPPEGEEKKERPFPVREINDYIPPPSRGRLGGGWGFVEVEL
jgi:hypothetical protein